MDDEAGLDWVSIERELRHGMEQTFGTIHPSGFLALEMDADTQYPDRLSDAELIDAMVGFERLTSWAQARQVRILAEFARRRPGDDTTMVNTDKPCSVSRFAPDEVGLALTQSRMAAKARIGRSVQLEQVLPETLQAWQQGRLDERRVVAICEATHYLDTEKARAVQRRVLDRAPQQTLAQLKAALKRAVVQADPDGAAADDDADAADTSADSDTDSGTGSGSTETSTATEHDAADDDADPADEGDNADDGADSADDTGTGGGAIAGGAAGMPPRPVNPGKPLVQILMPFTTLLGLDRQPCELVGHGPVPAELAREIAADATLRRLVYDPLSGTVLDHGRTTYRPPAGLADHVRARDVHCRSPICRRRALDGHLDHVVPFPDGPTSDTKLHGCCGHDHRMKHAPGWSVRALPDGRIQWITPTGHRYHTHDYRDEPDPPSPQADDPPDEPEPPPPPRWTQQDYDRVLTRRPNDNPDVSDGGDAVPF
ncbi:MAG TPA: DUF222 domain-containing protein [Pseudonocardia sp.]|nr:DUF222 domain-containing protein [Pseudonocardia sp.]